MNNKFSVSLTLRHHLDTSDGRARREDEAVASGLGRGQVGSVLCFLPDDSQKIRELNYWGIKDFGTVPSRGLLSDGLRPLQSRRFANGR